MNLLSKRPLGIIIIMMLCTLALYVNIESKTLKIIFASIIALLCVSSIFSGFFLKSKHLLLKTGTVCMVAAVLFSYLYFDIWFKAYERYDEKTVSAVGTVTELEISNVYSVGVTVKTENINDTKFSSYKIKFHLSSDDASELAVGARISFHAELSGFESYGNDFDTEQYYFSKGYNAYAENVSDIIVLGYEDPSFSNRLASYREMLTRRGIMLSNSDAGGLLGALLLGEKSNLSPQLKLDFARSGMSHALALSGMHLAILGMGFEKLLSFLGFGKRTQKFLLIFFVLTYMLLTGLPTSVVRAGLMLILSSLFFLLCGSKDSITNLILAVFVICILSPYSIFSLSLWLSAFATLGIIALSELFRYKTDAKAVIKFLRWCFTALLSSVFAIGATFFITASNFSGISLTSVLTNPIYSILIELYLYIGPLLLIFGEIIPIKYILIPISDLISGMMGFTSSIEWGYVSIDFTATKILIYLFSVFFFSYLIFKAKRPKAGIIIIIALFSSVYITTAILNYNNLYRDEVAYSADKYGDKAIAKSNGEVMLIDTSSYSSSSAYSAVSDAENMKLVKIDKYIVTHYSRKLNENILTIITQIKTDTVFLPFPENDDEIMIAEEITAILKDFRTELKFYINSATIMCGDFEFSRIHNTEYGTSSPKTAYTLTYSDRMLTYLSSGMLEKNSIKTATDSIAQSNAVIFGCHGKKYNEMNYIDFEYEDIGLFVISGENIAFMSECLKYYHAMGTRISMHPETEILYIE